MYENIVKRVPASGSRLIAIGIDHQKLIDAVTERVDIPSFELMPYTHLLDLNPWENLVRGKKAGVIFDIFHRNIFRGTAYIKDMPIRDSNFADYLHVTVSQVVRSIEDNLLKAELKQIDVRFIEKFNGPPQEELSDDEWYRIPNVNPEEILTILERRPEQFEPLTTADPLHRADCLDFKIRCRIFSDWEKLSYHGSLGIIKAHGSPLFVTSIPTGANNPNALSEEKISELLHNYFKSDYSKNEFRRIANFVCITHSSENGNSFGINRRSTFERMKSQMERCLLLPNTRRKKKSSFNAICPKDPETKETNGDFIKNNVINLRTNVTRSAHMWPKQVANTKLVCADNSELDVDKTSRLLLNCTNSFGYESSSNNRNTAVILIRDGDDT
uniref:Uncharacterized protein n=1 Tax=Romanomermis culicivorax TaxID=13658 RepID=A0A915J555_ROMCU